MFDEAEKLSSYSKIHFCSIIHEDEAENCLHIQKFILEHFRFDEAEKCIHVQKSNLGAFFVETRQKIAFMPKNQF